MTTANTDTQEPITVQGDQADKKETRTRITTEAIKGFARDYFARRTEKITRKVPTGITTDVLIDRLKTFKDEHEWETEPMLENDNSVFSLGPSPMLVTGVRYTETIEDYNRRITEHLRFVEQLHADTFGKGL